MYKPLSPETMALVKATAPALQQHGVEITTRMYQRLFVDPEIKALFDMAAHESGAQPKRLAAAILAFAQNVDKLDVLKPAIEHRRTPCRDPYQARTLSCGRQRATAGDPRYIGGGGN